jgi:dihydroorotase
MVGLESAASIVQTTLVDTGLISWEKFEQIMSRKPAQISGLSNQGQALEVGSFANIVLIDPKASSVVSGETQSKSNNNPYLGMTLSGKVIHTIFNGVITVRNSQVQQIGNHNAA